jgi:hypothetical protein
MNLSIQVLQDDQDIKNGYVQLAVNEGNRSGYQYFTLKEWEDFKRYCNEWTIETTHNIQKYGDNPLNNIDWCRNPYISMFIGNKNLNIELVFNTIQSWRKFKKTINDFIPELTVGGK